LLGAELRVRRARQLTGTLKRQLQGWADAHQDWLTIEVDADGNLVGVPRGDAARMGRISITSGEIVYNLRSALDYTVYDLARIQTGKPVDGTQFPIEDKPARFHLRITGKTQSGKYNPQAHWLKGVPPGAIALIKKLQPCYGCEWTRDLRELSNPDKHRHLAPLRATTDIRIRDQEVISTDPETGKSTIGVHYDAEVEVFFGDGRPVLETLQALADEAKAVVALFKRGFQPR
jgi:hypothetical protein